MCTCTSAFSQVTIVIEELLNCNIYSHFLDYRLELALIYAISSGEKSFKNQKCSIVLHNSFTTLVEANPPIRLSDHYLKFHCSCSKNSSIKKLISIPKV